jgi:anti-sigma factor RsiW
MTRRWWRREELRCREAGHVLQRYLDGELDDLGSRQVARHLEACRRCGMDAETYEEIKRALRRSAGRPPADALSRLRAFGRQLAEGWVPPDDHHEPADA